MMKKIVLHTGRTWFRDKCRYEKAWDAANELIASYEGIMIGAYTRGDGERRKI
mgnify:CR=1 FL=1